MDEGATGGVLASARGETPARITLHFADRSHQEAWAVRFSDPQAARRLAEEAGRRVGDAPRGLAERRLIVATCDAVEGAYEAALEGARLAYGHFATSRDALMQAHAGVVLGLANTRLGDYPAALACHAESLRLFRELGDAEGEALALLYTGGTHLDQGESRRALEALQEALRLLRTHDHEAHQAQAILMLGIAFEALGDYLEAHRCDLEALSLARAAGDARQEASLLNNLGTHYSDVGDSARALEHYARALELTGRVAHPTLRTLVLSNIGDVQLGTGDAEAALRSYTEALALSRVLGHRRNEGTALETLGEVHGRLGDADLARAHLRESLAVREAIGDRWGQAVSLVKLAAFHARQGEASAAASGYGAALALAVDIENRAVEVDALTGLGRLALGGGDPRTALGHLERALVVARFVGLKRQLAELFLALSEAAEALADHEQALRHFKAHHALVRELTDEGVARHTKRLALGLELERARQDVELERMRNVELAGSNARLEARDRENARLVAELGRQAREDALTGLPNRRSFTEALEKAFAHARRYERPLVVALADIDDFKRINDRFSHAVGDEVLKTLAGLFRGALRDGDLAARVGGEEFAFVFPETAEGEGRAVCERVRQRVANHDWRSLHPELRVTLSVGLACDAGLGNGERLLALADAKLYEAKLTGKDRVG